MLLYKIRQMFLNNCCLVIAKCYHALANKIRLNQIWELSNKVLYGNRITRSQSQKFKKRPILLSKFGKPNVWHLVFLRPLSLWLRNIWWEMAWQKFYSTNCSFEKYLGILHYTETNKRKHSQVPSCIWQVWKNINSFIF